MARALSPALINAITSIRVFPALLAEVEWASGTTRFWSGANDRVFMGNTFTAAGNLLGIASVQETVDLRANGIVLTLNGVNNAVLSLALSQRRQGKPVRAWIAFLDADDALLDAPYLIFDGRMDVPRISVGPETSTVSIQAESRLVDFQRPRRSRYTPEDQKTRYPGDRGFDFVPRIQSLRLMWGNQAQNNGRPTLTPPPPPPPYMDEPSGP